jgi:GAF domain-containing protein
MPVETLTQLVASDLPMDRVFEGFCSLLSQHMQAPIVVLIVRSSRGARVEYYWRQGDLVEPDTKLLPETSISAHVLREAKRQVYLRAQEWPPYTMFTFAREGTPTLSGIFEPLVFEGACIGVLTVQAFVPEAYADADVELVGRFAEVLTPRVVRDCSPA